MSREEIVLALLNLFRQQGYEGTSLAQISKVTGLGKASLYHYFPGGKEEMAQAALNYIDNWLKANIINPLHNDSAPQERLKAMCKQVGVFYENGSKSCLWAVLTLEQSSDRFNAQIKGALTLWIETLSGVLQETGIEEQEAKRRSQEAIIRIQGALVLARGLNETALFERTVQGLAKELLKEENLAAKEKKG